MMDITKLKNNLHQTIDRIDDDAVLFDSRQDPGKLDL